MNIPRLSLYLLTGALCFCRVEGNGSVLRYPDSTYFNGYAEPVPVTITTNPLDYAGTRIGLDVRNCELPRAYEADYRFVCRLPIIDCVSNRPLYLKQWAEENCEQVLKKQSRGTALSFCLSLLRGIDVSAQEVLYEQSTKEYCAEQLSTMPFTKRYREILLRLIDAYLQAFASAESSLVRVPPEKKHGLFSEPKLFILPDGRNLPPLTGDISAYIAALESARAVRYRYIFNAAVIMANALEEYIESTRTYKISDFYMFEDSAGKTFKVMLPNGIMVVSGVDDDTHIDDAAIIIDIAGNDAYHNNAGGTGPDGGVALCIDHGGHDGYLASDRDYVQGFGYLGVGMLIDLAGNDQYRAKRFAQGAGIIGVGMLWDREGDDVYCADAFCEGAGMCGLGVLFDDAGKDKYDCATLGQGSATTMGMGVLSDLDGDDSYDLAMYDGRDRFGTLAGYGQGGALSFRHNPWRGKLTPYGGVGMLLDGGGDDQYRTRGWCDQGGSYIMSLGVLYDRSGDDHYSSHSGQGSGIHITNAILIDKAGNDIYEGRFRAGGSAGDRSVGFLIDYSGNDTYISQTSSYGSGVKPLSYSLFVDYKGKDTYICSLPEHRITFNNWHSFGGVWPESSPLLWPYAMCLDLGGNDTYQVQLRANNSERHSFGHGIHIDTEWKGVDVIGSVKNPLEPYRKLQLPEFVTKSQYFESIRGLQDPDNFARFEAIGAIAGPTGDADIIPSLVATLMGSVHRQFNRDIMECIHLFLVTSGSIDKHLLNLIPLLRAPDPEVRTLIADDFGIWKVRQAEDALVLALEDDVASVRYAALKSLRELWSYKAVFPAIELATRDTSEMVRQAAVRLVTRRIDVTDPVPLYTKILQFDSSAAVQVEAAIGLANLHNPFIYDIVYAAAHAANVYVRRAGAQALIELRHIEGIEILINSLVFPSIDAFYNYDHNIPNVISAYTNADLSEEDRYNPAKWQAWFGHHKDSIDLDYTVRAYRIFRNITERFADSSFAAKLSMFEVFLDTFPDYLYARKVIARELDREAWAKVTAPISSPQFKPETALKYSLRSIELLEDPMFYSTLAEVYLVLRDYDKSEELFRRMFKLHPDDEMFRERLNRIEQLRNPQ